MSSPPTRYSGESTVQEIKPKTIGTTYSDLRQEHVDSAYGVQSDEDGSAPSDLPHSLAVRTRGQNNDSFRVPPERGPVSLDNTHPSPPLGKWDCFLTREDLFLEVPEYNRAQSPEQGESYPDAPGVALSPPSPSSTPRQRVARLEIETSKRNNPSQRVVNISQKPLPRPPSEFQANSTDKWDHALEYLEHLSHTLSDDLDSHDAGIAVMFGRRFDETRPVPPGQNRWDYHIRNLHSTTRSKHEEYRDFAQGWLRFVKGFEEAQEGLDEGDGDLKENLLKATKTSDANRDLRGGSPESSKIGDAYRTKVKQDKRPFHDAYRYGFEAGSLFRKPKQPEPGDGRRNAQITKDVGRQYVPRFRRMGNTTHVEGPPRLDHDKERRLRPEQHKANEDRPTSTAPHSDAKWFMQDAVDIIRAYDANYQPQQAPKSPPLRAFRQSATDLRKVLDSKNQVNREPEPPSPRASRPPQWNPTMFGRSAASRAAARAPSKKPSSKEPPRLKPALKREPSQTIPSSHPFPSYTEPPASQGPSTISAHEPRVRATERNVRVHWATLQECCRVKGIVWTESVKDVPETTAKSGGDSDGKEGRHLTRDRQEEAVSKDDYRWKPLPPRPKESYDP